MTTARSSGACAQHKPCSRNVLIQGLPQLWTLMNVTSLLSQLASWSRRGWNGPSTVDLDPQQAQTNGKMTAHKFLLCTSWTWSSVFASCGSVPYLMSEFKKMHKLPREASLFRKQFHVTFTYHKLLSQSPYHKTTLPPLPSFENKYVDIPFHIYLYLNQPTWPQNRIRYSHRIKLLPRSTDHELQASTMATTLPKKTWLKTTTSDIDGNCWHI